METTELLKRVRRIEIVAKGLSSEILSGSYHSAFKGRGVVFSEVRPYVIGDDVRRIDWNVTARMQEPFVKIFEEERELVVMLLLDISGSSDFGTQSRLKRHLMAEVAAERQPADARIARGHPLEHVERAVLRAVVNDDDLAPHARQRASRSIGRRRPCRPHGA